IDRMGEIGDPCGMPFATGCAVDVMPSRQMAVERSDRKDFTHRITLVGIFFACMISIRRPWLTLSKKPLMSK
ncbi:hypothetical protein CONPUDRAFT_19761, partial [Coniophora puteana RWD-64-598 SS2]